MKNNKGKITQLPILALREQLREEAVELSGKISRSVGRMASVDLIPCTEYHREIRHEHELIDKLLYVQNCRNVLEKAIERGAGKLHWHWADGHITVVTFQRQNNQIRMQISKSDD